ncbi:MAG TPA: hypothetical protein DEF47_00415 [Herpetosiphon sp.]|nr:hypothetical protein [Herpetosiphon sp.]
MLDGVAYTKGDGMVLLDDAFESTVTPALTSYIWLLRWCDSAQLAHLTPYSPEQIERFWQSALVIEHPHHGWYQLREAPSLNERPYREHEVFAAAFEYSQQQLNRLEAEAWQFELQRWLYYLEEYLEVLSARRDWPTIAAVLEKATSIPQVNLRQQQLLMLYKAIITMRLERQYDTAQSLLQQLRDDIQLEADLVPMVINSMGTLAWFRGAYDQAIQHYIEQHQHAQQVQNWLYQGHSLLNQSILSNQLQRPEYALELSLQALEALQRAGNRYREAHALYEVGSNLLYLCRWDEADSYFSRSAALYETLDTIGDLANLYWHIGFLKHLAGDLPASEQAYQISIEAARASVVPNDDSLRDSLAFLGLLYCSMHEYQTALEIYAQAEALARQHNNRHELALILNQRGDAERRSGAIDAAYAAFAESIAIIEDLRTSFGDEDTKLGLISTAQQVYEHMVVLCIERGDAAQAVNYIERARSRAFLDALQAGDESTAIELSQQCADLAEIQAQLDQRTAVIEYFTVGVLGRSLRFLAALAERKSPILHHFSLDPALYSVAITANNATIHQHSFNPLNLTRGHGGHHRLLQPRILKAISQALIEPYEAMLATVDLVYVVPHGPLHDVPFMALQTSDGNWLVREENPAIALAPSATILVRYALGRAASSQTQHYCFGYNSVGAEALTYAEHEAQEIAKLVGGQAWTGALATDQFLRYAHDARIIHIASHCVYDAQQPLNSHLILGHETLSAQTIMDQVEIDTDLVVLSACVSGRSFVAVSDDQYGLQRAFLYAGTRSLLCSLWNASDVAALFVMDRFYRELQAGVRIAIALKHAVIAVRDLTRADIIKQFQLWQLPASAIPLEPDGQHSESPLADPRFWAGFMVIGKA